MLTDSIIPNLSNGDVIYKITGRLFLKNFNILITDKLESIIGSDFDNRRTKRTDTRFWKTTKQYYMENLIKLTNRIDENKGWCIEDVYQKIGGFVQQPVFIGRSGASGDMYSGMLNIDLPPLPEKQPIKKSPLFNFRVASKHNLRSFKNYITH
jgi:hypothetical protein